MKIEHEHFLMGEHLGAKFVFTQGERDALEKVMRLAEGARALLANEDADEDTLLAEIEHGCRDLLSGLSVDIECDGEAGER